MKKTPFVTKQQVEEIVKKFPTPFHLYDEAGIRANAQAVKDAFAWNPGFREYFAVKATPNPYLLKILKDYDMGCDCSSYTELMLSKSCGFDGEHIMFSSNDTPAEEFAYADKLGAIINLDDFTHIDFLEKTIGHIPETISCRYNPGGVFTLSNGIMDNPGDSKYGMTKEQLFEAFKILKSKGAKYFGVHAFLASNTVTNEYYPQLAKELFELVVELKKETGCDIKFVNLSGGVGVAYKPDQTPNDISVIGAGVHKVYDEVLVPAGMGDVAIYGSFTNDTILNALRKNIISGVLTVSPEEIGKKAADSMTEYKDSGFVTEYSTIDIQSVTPDNVDKYVASSTDSSDDSNAD